MVELHEKLPEFRTRGNQLGLPPRILVVDDNRDSAHTLTRLLNVLGLSAVSAYSGVSAIEEIERFRPALAFVDLCMPEMNGIETAVRIRQSPEGRDIILIALSGLTESPESRDILDAGFSTRLLKPININTLEETLAHYVGYQADGPGPTPK
jgi:CheY-like chemotaxis protein